MSEEKIRPEGQVAIVEELVGRIGCVQHDDDDDGGDFGDETLATRARTDHVNKQGSLPYA